MSKAIEFVAFKLKKNVSKEAFFPISEMFTREFLAKQPGYLSRKLLSKGDMWADLVFWETEADHLNAMEASKKDAAAAEYLSMLNLSAKGSFYHLFAVEKSYD
jgi:heme-degrading monooxygenase HmoA